MADEPPLTDEQVHELLHDCLLKLSDRTVATQHGQDILTMGMKQIELLQRALLILSEGEPSETPPET